MTIGVFLGVLLGCGTAHAQASRTWVSGVGDDANPCSRTAPCKTFAGAISKTATGGEIDALDPGGYGGVTITKPITIDGGGGQVASVLVAGTNGVVISAGATDTIILKNLAIQGLAMSGNGGINGVRILSAGSVHIEHCSIMGFTNHGVDAEAGEVFVTDTNVDGNGMAGIFFTNTRGTVDRVTASNNSSSGFRVSAGANVTIKNSTASGGAMGFVAADAASAVLDLQSSITTHNQYGIVAGFGATVRASDTSIVANTLQGLYTDGSSALLSFGTNRVTGNSTDGSFTGTILLR